MCAGVLAVRRAQAIRARIAAADDHHALAGGQNLIRHGIAFADLIRLRQEIHREMDALQLAARNFQIARLLGAARQQDGVEIALQIRSPAHSRRRAR